VIVAANHLSHVDPLVFAHFVHDQGRSVRFLAKHQLFEVPLFGRFIAGAGQIPVRRQTRTAGVALDAASRGYTTAILERADADAVDAAGRPGLGSPQGKPTPEGGGKCQRTPTRSGAATTSILPTIPGLRAVRRVSPRRG
jgi:1-acyl-sn-glycerol-3-phosphate acyltransferase